PRPAPARPADPSGEGLSRAAPAASPVRAPSPDPPADWCRAVIMVRSGRREGSRTMAPFEFVIVFVSFIYALALTHLLIAAAAMLRHRRRLTLSVPHLLWMAAALLLLVINWLSLYDFHRFERIPLRFFLMGLVFSVVQYVLCALVSPDFEAGETMDLRLFFERERVTFLAAFLVLMLLAMASNFAIAREAGLGWWGGKNFVVGAMT